MISRLHADCYHEVAYNALAKYSSVCENNIQKRKLYELIIHDRST